MSWALVAAKSTDSRKIKTRDLIANLIWCKFCRGICLDLNAINLTKVKDLGIAQK
jgi:hypothetical protein